MATPSTIKTASKAGKKSKVVTLRLPVDVLANFPSSNPASSKPSPSSSPEDVAQAASERTPSIQPPPTADKASDAANTPVPAGENEDSADPNSLAPPAGTKRKRGGGAVSGRKRAPPSIDPNAPPKERGRPGPKKKPRLPDGTIDRSQDTSKKANQPNAPNGIASAAIPAHKLGPKANTGAINAGLRALDRSGKACRRWERKGLSLKSFTGTQWSMPSWRTPAGKEGFAGDVKSDESTGSASGRREEGRSSVVGSERSGSGEGGGGNSANGAARSPAPIMA